LPISRFYRGPHDQLVALVYTPPNEFWYSTNKTVAVFGTVIVKFYQKIEVTSFLPITVNHSEQFTTLLFMTIFFN
jgi:hypothetical protein